MNESTPAPGGFFSRIPLWVMDADISDGAYRLYGALMAYADRNTGKCTPSRRTLAARLKRSDRRIDAFMAELVEIGAVTIRKRVNPDNPKVQTSSEYQLVTQEGGVKPFPSAGGSGSRATRVGAQQPPGGSDISFATPAKHSSGGSDKSFATRGERNDGRVAMNPSHEPEPLNQNHLNQKSEVALRNARPHEHPAINVATQLRTDLNGAISYNRAIHLAKWAIDDAHQTPQQATMAIKAIYQLGKPLSQEVLGQYLTGAFTNRGRRTGNQISNDVTRQLQLAQRLRDQPAPELDYKETA